MSIRSQEKVDRTGFAEEEIAKARTALEVSGDLDDPAVVSWTVEEWSAWSPTLRLVDPRAGAARVAV